jgi:hypothetical protein
VKNNFERNWQAKLRHSISQHADQDLASQVLEGGDRLTDQSPRSEVHVWTNRAMAELNAALDQQTAMDILCGCACHYSRDDLMPLKDLYIREGDISKIHAILERKFREFLETTLALTEAEIETVVSQGWGLAGRLEGKTIIATKIPKSSYLKTYLRENDPQRRREIYCHCPRVRTAVKANVKITKTYCYCGAGFYQDIWETILDRPVHVKVLSSVLQGDDVCTIAITLPA